MFRAMLEESMLRALRSTAQPSDLMELLRDPLVLSPTTNSWNRSIDDILSSACKPLTALDCFLAASNFFRLMKLLAASVFRS
jgi:hypothetical protein